MIRLTVYEVRRQLDTRASVALFASCIVLASLLAAVGLIQRSTSNELGLAQLGAAAVVPFAILAPVIGALAASSDWASGVIQHTLMVEPRRGRVFLAKAVASLAVALGTSLLGAVTASVAGLTVSVFRGQSVDFSGIPAAVGGALSIIVPGCLFGFGVGSAFMVPAVAIAVVLGVELALDVALGFVPHGIGTYLQSSAVYDALTTGDNALSGVTSAILWILIPAGIGWRRYHTREASS